MAVTSVSWGDFHVGVSNLKLDEEMDLGEGVRIRPTYAHIMGPFLAAFAPAPPGRHHPAPWKALSGGVSFDVSADLCVPEALGDEQERSAIVRTLLFLLRVGGDPAIIAPVLSTHAFGELAQQADHVARLVPFEIQPRRYPLSIGQELDAPSALRWVADHWRPVHGLRGHAAFGVAVDAIDGGQFVESPALSLVSMWGALEALFVPNAGEVRFRVSAMIAAYLEEPGAARAELQRQVAKLYEKRSAGAHGRPAAAADGLLDTFYLLRRVLLRVIEYGRVPERRELEERLFGG